MAALMYASPDKSAAAVFALGLKINGTHIETLALRGLDPEASYSVKEINRGESLHADDCQAPASGRSLMEKGIKVSLSGDYDSAVFEIVRRQ